MQEPTTKGYPSYDEGIEDEESMKEEITQANGYGDLAE